MAIFRKIRFLFIIIIPAILWVGYNNIANRHSHLLEYGLTTTHAHKYEKAQVPGKEPVSHNHSKKEIIYLNQVFDTLLVTLTIAGISIILAQVTVILPVRITDQLISNTSYSSLPARGPPAVRFK